ncbi:MAG TPA: UDP-N-acetylglucosamine 2-epimerase (non-hydrolyzing) [Terriglobales bacterium]|jgi:UDP-N-acetylglucosamine 2-epimerase (non-hydrolysing)|nr:UDP-N-acetylglucosamine 2-epimerase (non-hydrolyzing) [Terriglobales bacterium]
MHVVHIVGARPNFMKAAPVHRALTGLKSIRQSLIHTGQHYDAGMSDIFFQQLEMPPADVNLGVGSGSQAQQTAEVMIRLEPFLAEQRPQLVLVYGDVNSTLAAALVCAKLNVKLGHVEAGLRSGDRTMPEEINRIVTDRLAQLLFTPSPDGDENLLREGVDAKNIHRVGNVMIDTLMRLLPHCPDSQSQAPWILVTLHRPSNVDDLEWLGALLNVLSDLSQSIPVIFPVHPRTRQRIADLGPKKFSDRLQLVDPRSYLEFLALQKGASLVITDSGGVQEETTFLGVPCLTVRENTERPITIELGTNQLVGRDLDLLRTEAKRILSGEKKKSSAIPLWDGHAADRIANTISELI